MAQLDILPQPQRQKHRQEKDRLQLKGQCRAEEHHARRAALLQPHIQSHQAQRAVNCVALSPVCAVKDDCRQNHRQIEDHQL